MAKYFDTVGELLLIYLAVLLVGAGAYAALEHKAYLDAFWWACVTATTVGYGDVYPATLGGKIVAIVLMHVTLLMVLPMLIGTICSRFVRDQNEFSHQEQEDLKAALRRLEAKLDALDPR